MHAHLANLERAGLLRRDPTKPRALELIGRERPAGARRSRRAGDVVRLPLLGEIAAGGPLLAEQNIEDTWRCRRGAKGDFLLRVKGESMIDAGILDGDLVIVQRAQDARNGEIVVALAGDDEAADEATVKTFYREADRVRLQPENSALEPIYARARPDPRPGRRGLPGALTMTAADAAPPDPRPGALALLRGASLECLACGEFVMHARGGVVFCPECGSKLGSEAALAETAEGLGAEAG